ncbi:glutamate carboxypeptidase II [Seiridium cupressi]
MRTLAQDEAERHMLRAPSVDNLKHWSRTYSSRPHLAGDLQHAESIRDLWRSYGIEAEIVRYDVLQNFPVRTSLKLLSEDGTVAFNASLKEDAIPEDPTSSPDNGWPAFHGFSANGNVTAELIYANFGTLADFKLLESKGILVQGKIVICKYSKVFRGLKVRAAQKFGAAAVIIYSDPQEDGELTAANGHKPYPEGPARHPTSIQRGSVDFFSVAVGDPTTPGYPSLPGSGTERRDPSYAIPSIPSLPISFADALPLLKALRGHGLPSEDMGGNTTDWRGALPDVDYFTGPSNVKISVFNHGEYRYSPIYNVIGAIPGRTKEIVMLGNHHDSWCCGAVDPVSGGAAMNEVVRGLGGLCDAGWRPYRKIIIASWDNEEYGLVGSTEYGEEHEKEISNNCVAYINVDESTNGGDILGATGSPLLAYALVNVMQLTPSPLETGRTVYDDWESWKNSSSNEETGEEASGLLAPMGTGSDYTVFLHHMGIPSLDLVFNKRGSAVYPYHSNYDSYFWVERFGDPGFKKHLAMARLWGTLAVRLAGITLLNFKAHDYATTLNRHFQQLRTKAVAGLRLKPLEVSLAKFAEAAAALDELARGCDLTVSQAGIVSRVQIGVSDINRRYREVEKSFILKTEKGLPGRPWYKHTVFAPGLWAGYDGVVFPGILENIDDGDISEANRWVEIIAQEIERAAVVATGADYQHFC